MIEERRFNIIATGLWNRTNMTMNNLMCEGFTGCAITGCQSAQVPKSLRARRMPDGVRNPSRRCRGGFAEEVAGNVQKGEAPTLL